MASSLAVTNKPGASGSAREDEGGAVVDREDDAYGLAGAMDSFNVVEVCVRYSDRLAQEIRQTGSAVFAKVEGAAGAGAGAGAGVSAGSAPAAKGAASTGHTASSSELDRLKACCDDVDASRVSFQQVWLIDYLLMHVLCF
jgi:hypothetical protein